MTGCSVVDTRDAAELESGRGSRTNTSMDSADHSQRRREKRRPVPRPPHAGRFVNNLGATGEGCIGASESAAAGEHAMGEAVAVFGGRWRAVAAVPRVLHRPWVQEDSEAERPRRLL